MKESVSGLAEWREKLFTEEDRFFVHKILGMSCLISFVVRCSIIGADSDMGFRSHPEWTLPTLLLHFLLNLSSFDFRIPAKRIKEGTRVWPEYRLHSIIFLSRHLASILLYWYEGAHHLDPSYDWNLLIILTTSAAADLASASVQYPSRTIRDVSAPAWVKVCFSTAQFYSTV